MSDEKRSTSRKNKPKEESLDELKSFTPPEVLSVKQAISTEDLREKFPNLHSEMTEKQMQLRIDSIEEHSSTSSEPPDLTLDGVDPYRNYEPSTLDYIRRAQTDREAEEIILFALKQGNITKDESEKLLNQLSKDGVRSFGPIRTHGHYFRKAVEARNRQLIKKRYSIPK